MRSPGETRLALLKAATELTTVARSPTLREVATHAKVGYTAAMQTVKHMTRSGALKIVRHRRVEYRNKPVAEYAPVATVTVNESVSELASAMASWVR